MQTHPRPPDPRAEPSVNATWCDARWRLEARAEGHVCAATANPPMHGIVGRSAVRLGEYLAIVIDGWTDDQPPAPVFHGEWRDVADLIAEFEGHRPR